MKQTVEVTHQHLYPLYNQARCLVGTEPPSLCLQYRVYIPHRSVLFYIYLASVNLDSVYLWVSCVWDSVYHRWPTDACNPFGLVFTSFILLTFEGSTGDQYNHCLVDILQIKWSYDVYFLLLFMRIFFYLSFAISFIFQDELFTSNVIGFIFHCLLLQQCLYLTYCLICTSVY